MKNFIAGFRSDNKIKKIIAIIYYILTAVFFIIGSSWKLDDVFLLGMLLIMPSLVLNFIGMFKKDKNHRENKKRFWTTFAVYMMLVFMFTSATPEIEEYVDSSVSSTEENIENNNEDESKEEPKKEIEVVEETIEKAEIHFIDTGNSDAILIKYGDKAALVDAGDNDDEQSVVSYLKAEGVTELEYVFATHPHADHIGGLDAVVNSIAIKNLYVSNGEADTKTYTDFINAMASKGLNPSVPLLNSEFKLGSSTFKVLSVANEKETNNNSLVLLYTNGDDKILLMGDAEGEIEAKLNPGDIDLLKVGHHGSSSSSSSSFINKTSPEYAVITVGQNNKYGHPHVETMDTLKNNGIEVHRNDECGHVVFTSTGDGLSVGCKVGSYQSGNNKSSSDSNKNNPQSVVAETSSPKPTSGMVYANGGSSTSNKYHSNPSAHNMEGAIEMSEDSAVSKGYVACKKCY